MSKDLFFWCIYPETDILDYRTGHGPWNSRSPSWAAHATMFANHFSTPCLTQRARTRGLKLFSPWLRSSSLGGEGCRQSTQLAFWLRNEGLQGEGWGKGMVDASSYLPPHAEPRAAITATSYRPAFCRSSSNILSSPGLYEDLIFPCVSCQVSSLVKFWCSLHESRSTWWLGLSGANPHWCLLRGCQGLTLLCPVLE